MERQLLFIALFSLGSMSQAAVAPYERTSLYAHMLEINAQWRVQDPAGMVGDVPVTFVNDAQRIATHLHFVRERLATNVPAGFTPAQIEQRMFLLSKLERYADRGRFPQNHVLPYRNPVFIDPHGTACAVGQLMIESGHHALADEINSSLSLAYLLDMRTSALWPRIASWAETHGFTANELAWIQPAYDPQLPWASLGTGTNGTVTVTKTLANGDVFIGGEFTEAGGVAANNVAIWNGTGYEALGAGMEGTVRCAIEFNGELYVGGSFLFSSNDLAKWNGTSWDFSTVFQGKGPNINALHVHYGALYAAGDIVGFAGTNPLVQRLDGSYWTPIGSYFDGSVLALASHNGNLVAAGAFTTTTSPTTTEMQHVAFFNGTDWEQLGAGLDAQVRDLLDVNGTLYASGDLYANIVPTFGLARISVGAPQWEELLPNHESYMYNGLGPMWISSMVEHQGFLYLGGKFYISPMLGTYGSNVAKFHGNPDEVSAMIVLDEQVNDVTVQGNSLIIGGAFSAVHPHLATLELNMGVNDRDRGTLLRVGPNPSTDVITARINGSFSPNPGFRIIDASGRSIPVNAVRSGDATNIDVRSLAAGLYVIEAVGDEEVITARFVKE